MPIFMQAETVAWSLDWRSYIIGVIPVVIVFLILGMARSMKTIRDTRNRERASTIHLIDSAIFVMRNQSILEREAEHSKAYYYAAKGLMTVREVFEAVYRDDGFKVRPIPKDLFPDQVQETPCASPKKDASYQKDA